jgi:hypothetical protein
MSGETVKYSGLDSGAPAQEGDILAVARPGAPNVSRRLTLNEVRPRVTTAAASPTPAANAAAGYRAGSLWTNTARGSLWAYVRETAGAAEWEWLGPAIHGGMLAGRNYPLVPDHPTANTAGPAVGQLYMAPFRTPGGAPILSLGGMVVTGQVGTVFKCGIWRDGGSTPRPVGLPLAWHNAGAAAETSATLALAALNVPFAHVAGEGYWYGWIQSWATAPTWLGLQGASLGNAWQTGDGFGVAATSNPVGLRTPLAYATDISTVDLTAAVWTIETVARFPSMVGST